MNAKVSVLFYAKKSKAVSLAKVPIYLRITVNGKRAEFSTGKNVVLDKWCSIQSRQKGSSEEARTLNKYLDVLNAKILEIERNLVLSGDYFDANDIKNILTGKSEEERFLIAIFDEHNKSSVKVTIITPCFLTIGCWFNFLQFIHIHQIA